MTLNEFTTIIRYLRSQDIEIVELGRQLGELCNLTLTPCGHAT